MDKLEDFIQKKQKMHVGEVDNSLDIQHNLKKMTARERIDFLLDEQSFVEIGAFIKESSSGVITGYGTIGGRLIYVYAYDYDIKGGALNLDASDKICNIMNMALKMGAPLVQMVDSLGADVSEDLNILKAYGKIINMNSKLSGVVPQISIILGPCTGMSTITAAMSDFTIISEDNGSFYVNSPSSISVKQNDYVAYNMYASAEKSSQNGSIQLSAKDEKAALELAKSIFEFIPSNNMEFSYRKEITEEEQVKERLNEIALENNKDMYEVINILADKNSFIEFDKAVCLNSIVGFARINGLPIGIIATNAANNKGYINKKAIEKITRFVKVCNSFNISLLSMVDCIGFEPNLQEEVEGLALSLSKMTYALCDAVVPKVALIVGKAYGSAYISLASKHCAFDSLYAWPTASIAMGSPENIIKSMHKQEIDASENPKDKEKEVIEKYYEELTSPYKAAEQGQIDDIIMPSETKAHLYMMLDMLQSKREIKYPKKHGSTLI